MFVKSMRFKQLLSFVSVLLMLTTGTVMGAGATQAAQSAQAGITWTSQVSASDNNWDSVAYGNGLFVAVSYTGNGNRVMTSPDGINWTSRTTPNDNLWTAVTYGNGLFVAVAIVGPSPQWVMTSPDGINWTGRTAAANSAWTSVTYGNGLFVAVGESGTNRVMTSPDGINWTSRTSAFNYLWNWVTYADGKFVAVSSGPGYAIPSPTGIKFVDAPGSAPGNVMTSTDGITWTLRPNAPNDGWHTVVYGNGVFVSTSYTGSGNAMTSPDGINWTLRPTGTSNEWHSVTFGEGLFVAVSETGSGNRVMTSPDGINWTSRKSAADNAWHTVTYADGLFVAVSYTGAGNRVMTSGSLNRLAIGQGVGDAYSTMMANSEGKSLVGGKNMMREFAVLSAESGPADVPWLCDLTGTTEVEGKGGVEIVSMEFVSEKGRSAVAAVQDIHVFSDENQAKRAYDDIAKKIKRCKGQHQAADDEGLGNDPTGATTTLTNGTKKAVDGDPFLWVRSTTTVPGSGGFVEHEYKTVRHFGSYLQIVQVQSEGVSAPKITAKQIRNANLLTDSLGDRWRATFS